MQLLWQTEKIILATFLLTQLLQQTCWSWLVNECFEEVLLSDCHMHVLPLQRLKLCESLSIFPLFGLFCGFKNYLLPKVCSSGKLRLVSCVCQDITKEFSVSKTQRCILQREQFKPALFECVYASLHMLRPCTLKVSLWHLVSLSQLVLSFVFIYLCIYFKIGSWLHFKLCAF